MAGTITTDLTIIDAADVTGTWTVIGTAWAAIPIASSDVYLQGTGAINGNVSTSSIQTTRFAGVATAANLDLTVSERHLFFWIKVICLPATESRVRGGLGIFISSDATPTLDSTVAIPWDGPTNSKVWFVSGKDFDPTSGWVGYVVNPQGTPNQTLGTPVMSTVNRAGIRSAILLGVGGGAVKPKPWLWDKMAYGSSLTINDGTAGTPVTFADILAVDSSVTNSYGILTQAGGIFYGAGKLIFGTIGQTAITFFKDTNQVIVFQDFPVAATFYELKLAGAAGFATTVQFGNFSGGLTSGGVTIKGVSLTEQRAIAPVIVAGGTGYTAGDILTVSGGTFVTAAQIRVITVAAGVITVARMETAGKYSVVPTGTLATTGGTGTGGTFTVTFVGGSIWTLTANAANQTLNLYGCALSEMKSAALASTTSVRGCSITNSGTVTSNSATIDNCTFQDLATAAPISATWALIINSSTEMSTVTKSKFINCNKAIKITAIGTYAFVGITFSGNTFDVENASTGLVTINVSGGGDTPTVTNTGAGATTTVVNAVTVKVTCLDAKALTTIQNVRVLLTADTGGPLPFQVSVTITRVTTTATVTHTAHGRKVGEKMLIKGAVQPEYNGIQTITAITTNTYDYTVSGTPATPATGTITSTMVILSGLTDINGVIQDTGFNYPGVQPVTGRARKSTATPMYATTPLIGSITTAGATLSAFLVPDE